MTRRTPSLHGSAGALARAGARKLTQLTIARDLPAREGAAVETPCAAALTLRRQLEQAIEAAIALLDMLDGDPDLEAEIDCSVDDIGEEQGRTWLDFAHPHPRRFLSLSGAQTGGRSGRTGSRLPDFSPFHGRSS